MSFWDKNQELINEDVTGSRERRKVEPIVGTRRLTNAKSITVEQIEADSQHREEFDEESLERLANSMRSHGQLQPIRVRFDAERGRYVIIAGERRWRAAKVAGLTSVDCTVVDGDLSESDILREQIIENAVREDLRPTEQGKAFVALMEREGWNGKELAEKINVHPSTVSRAIGLLKLPEETQGKVDRGELSITQALKQEKETVTKSGKKSKRPSKEKKIRTSVGITITLKARKLLKDEQIEVALREALTELERAA